jgi:CheY-like chemotaxis protein
MPEKRKRLLVIEDNDGDVFLIKRAIQQNGIPAEVTVCADGETAIRLLNPDLKAPPDAIIVDLSLPRVDGLHILRQILDRPAFVGTPIMVFTSSPSPSDKHRVKLLANARYVQKPSDLTNFLREVADNVTSMLSLSRRWSEPSPARQGGDQCSRYVQPPDPARR